MAATYLFSILLSFGILSQALDLSLYPNDGCTGSPMTCSNYRYNTCCTGNAPFCNTGLCSSGCRVGNDIASFNRAACTGAAFDSCKITANERCCLPEGGGNSCAIIANQGNAPMKRDGVEQVETDDIRCEGRSVRPNRLAFVDDENVEHDIHIPTSRYEEAVENYVNRDWVSLAGFPVWANQSYTDADFI